VPVLMPFKLESFSNAAYYAFYILSAVAFFWILAYGLLDLLSGSPAFEEIYDGGWILFGCFSFDSSRL
jgi:hypothetical protein